jgi:transposase
MLSWRRSRREIAMSYAIQLTYREVDALDALRLRTPSADVFRNCLIILLSNTPETAGAIAQRLRCSAETVKRVRKLYRTGGLKALHPVKPSGRPSRATRAFRDALREAATTNPLTLGYGFSNWSAGRLAAHLAKVTGVRFSDDQIRRLLHREGLSYQRPKHTMKGKRNEAAFRKSRRQLIALKKGRFKLIRAKL